LSVADAEIAQARRSLLTELETSLLSSQRAILTRDVARLEQSCGQQIRLLRALQILDPAQADLTFGSELRSARMRVLHLARVQAALLARGQRWLRTVENLLAGAATNYGPAAALRYGNLGTVAGEKEHAPCRD
jgi:hypothetical protein